MWSIPERFMTISAPQAPLGCLTVPLPVGACLAQHQTHVLPAEAEGVRQRVLDLPLQRGGPYVGARTRRVHLVAVVGGWQHTVGHGERAGRRLDHAGRAEP